MYNVYSINCLNKKDVVWETEVLSFYVTPNSIHPMGTYAGEVKEHVFLVANIVIIDLPVQP